MITNQGVHFYDDYRGTIQLDSIRFDSGTTNYNDECRIVYCSFVRKLMMFPSIEGFIFLTTREANATRLNRATRPYNTTPEGNDRVGSAADTRWLPCRSFGTWLLEFPARRERRGGWR